MRVPDRDEREKKIMKIFSRKKQDEILKRVTACQIICIEYITDNDTFEKMTENLANIAAEIGGEKGMKKVLNTVKKYNISGGKTNE